jgi:hypothetical protein
MHPDSMHVRRGTRRPLVSDDGWLLGRSAAALSLCALAWLTGWAIRTVDLSQGIAIVFLPQEACPCPDASQAAKLTAPAPAAALPQQPELPSASEVTGEVEEAVDVSVDPLNTLLDLKPPLEAFKFGSDIDATDPSSTNYAQCGGHRVSDFRTSRLLVEPHDLLPPPLLAEEGQGLSGEPLLVRRRMYYDGRPAFLVTGLVSLHTALYDAILLSDATERIEEASLAKTPLFSLLRSGRQRTIRRIDSLKSPATQHRVALTVDLCPSTRPIETQLFSWLGTLAYSTQKALPLGFAVTGAWIAEHGDEFAALRSFCAQSGLVPTWINHSYSHPRHPGRGRDLFLTHPRTRLNRETLDLELMLLEHGLVPSVYFRFPGLVVDAETLRELNDLDLVALDADAWLGNDQDIANGSVILIHGNGNEGQGLRHLRGFIAEHWLDLHEGQLEFASLDLLGHFPDYSPRVRRRSSGLARGESWLDSIERLGSPTEGETH